MAHFAEISPTNEVLRVVVVGDDQEHRGQEFLANDLGLGGTWIQCSFNHRIRKQFPSAGYKYDAVNDVFIAPQHFPSWSLNSTFDWVPPIAMPTDGNPYFWDESTCQWVEAT